MPHVLHTIWLDSHEPTNKDTLWIKPLKKDYYGIFVYGSNGWVLTTALFKGTIGEFVIDQLPEATTESNGVMSAQDKRDLEMLKEALANIDVIIEAINNIDQTPTEGSQHMITSGGVYESLEGKVDAVDGKGLSTEDFTSEEKNKLASIPDDIVNGIQSDWNTNNNDSVSYIKNRTHWEENGVVHKLHPKFLDMDASPTSGSTKPVTSGGVKEALDGKQDVISDLADIRQGAGLGGTAYQKPSTGIPASDLASGVIPDVSGFITRTVNDLANYYLKSETYTKEEVAALISAIRQFHYEVYAALPATGEGNVLYLIGPTGSGSDKYEEYVYANNGWVKIGDTSIDLSGYVTIEALNQALSGYVTSAALATALTGKVDKVNGKGLSANDYTDAAKKKTEDMYETFAEIRREITVTAGSGIPASALNDIILEPGVYEFVLKNVTTTNSGRYTLYGAQSGIKGTIDRPAAIRVTESGAKNFWVGDITSAITTSGTMEAVLTRKTESLVFKADSAVNATANRPGGMLFGDFFYGTASSTYLQQQRVSNNTRIYFPESVILRTRNTSFRFWVRGYDAPVDGNTTIPYTDWVRRCEISGGTYVTLSIEKNAHSGSNFVPMDEFIDAMRITDTFASPVSDVLPLNYTHERFMNLTYVISQGGSVHDDYFVGAGAASDAGTVLIRIYNLATKSFVKAVTVTGVATNTHSNTISFGGVKYDEGDIFPLLYISTGNLQNGTTISDVYVVRLAGDIDTLAATIIQTIHLDFGTWTDWFCDADKGRGWVKTGNNDFLRFRCYDIPDITEAEVTITQNDTALADFSIPPVERGNGIKSHEHQGCFYSKGRIYFTAGNPNSTGEDGTYLEVINVRNKCRNAVIWLTDMGLTNGTSANYEPESCFIWRGQLYIAFPSFIELVKGWWQPALVSGTNIKTINGQSILGGGDIDTNPAVGTSQPSGGMLPNVFYNLGSLSGSVTFALAAATDNTILNHYYWTFDTPSTVPSITWPTGLTWVGGSAPTLSASKHYEISVINGIATYMEV